MVALLSLPLGPAAGAGPESVVGAQTPAAPRDSTAAAPDSNAVTTAPSVAFAADTVSSRSTAWSAARESLATAPPPRARRTLPKPGRFDQPRWVMLRSLLVPGWGQVHNRAWIKAALVVLGDGALRVRFVRDERRLGDLARQGDGRQSALVGAIADTVAAWVELVAAREAGNAEREAAALAVRQTNLTRFFDATGAYNSIVPLYNALLETSINRRWLLGGVVLYALIDAYVDAHFKNFDVNLQFDPALPGGTGVPGARLQIRWAF